MPALVMLCTGDSGSSNSGLGMLGIGYACTDGACSHENAESHLAPLLMSSPCASIHWAPAALSHQPSSYRSYCFSGHNVDTLPFEIGPDSKGICTFAKTPYSLRGSVGIVVCKADTFFLAITFSNPYDYVLYKIEFALEIFTEPNHLGNLSDVFSKMMKSKPYSSSSLFQRAALESEHETLEVSKGSIRVQAKMSNCEKAILKVQVEDMDPPPYSKGM